MMRKKAFIKGTEDVKGPGRKRRGGTARYDFST